MNQQPIIVDSNGVATLPDVAVPQRVPFMQFWQYMLAAAAFARARVTPYRGHEPRLLGTRASARAQGYTSAIHMARTQAAHRLLEPLPIADAQV